MKKITKSIFLFGLVGLLGACERVKDQEAVAALPETSKEDTLVFTPDSVEIDTTYYEGNAAYTDDDATYEPAPESYADQREFATSDGSAPTNGAGTAVTSSTETTTTTTKTTTSATAVKKKYVRPTKSQLQSALAADAKRSSRMSLNNLRNYWLQRQHYYRRATKEVKFVAGPTKIKINQEETKIETSRGKVKIEGQDIKVKPD
ncbi:hypothetical protein [Rufibacter sp. LB8]|uniref:hypothetical protein n=1 Tax=Rufibacter sp. LB8 TaxID=2777781 RepID=UPI00178C5C58|nr:hypothetical protein [Rufibacter sp. LB8]